MKQKLKQGGANMVSIKAPSIYEMRTKGGTQNV